MADKKRNIKDLEGIYNKQKQISESRIKLLNDELNQLNNILDMRKRIAIEEEINNERSKISKSIQNSYEKSIRDGYKIHKNTAKSIEDKVKSQNKLLFAQKQSIKNQKNIIKLKDNIVAKTRSILEYTIQQDSYIKSTILNLGLSNAKAEQMRSTFEDSAGYVSRLGGDLSNIQQIMQTFADTTGRAKVLTSGMVNDITLIGKGTGLGIENAAKLASQFEYMGLDVKNTMNYVQGVVETSELMGVNTNKVLANINDNFKELQKYTFSQGVKGFAELSAYSEKFRINMDSALGTAEKARNLENAVNLAAELQVMGGEFAKTDPFQLLFLSRNDPAAFTKKINEMTQGVVTFRKMADGTFEKFISPADQDRLRRVADVLGMQTQELVDQSLRMAEIQKIRQQTIGMGLSNTEKQLIEGMANFNSNTGKFTVQIAGVSKDIQNITKQELKILNRQSKSLEERALASQTFDDALKNTIAEFKTLFLPVLRGFNKVITTVRPIVTDLMDWMKTFADTKGGWFKISGMLLAAGSLWKIALQPLLGRGIANTLRGISSIRTKVRGTTPMPTATTKKGLSGKGKLMSGLGVGAAGLGMGAGIGLAAEGVSSLADSMSKLTPEQGKVLKTVVSQLTILSGIGVAAATAVSIFGTASKFASLGLLAFGGAVLMVGGGINIATTGVSKMTNSLSNLITNANNAGPSLFKIAKGIGAISVATGSMMVTGSGLPALAATLHVVSKKANDVKKVGDSFKYINAVLSGTKNSYGEIESMIDKISNADFSNLKQLKQLNNLFNKPIKVEFSDKEVAITSDITLNIDGQKFLDRLSVGTKLPVIQKDISGGRSS